MRCAQRFPVEDDLGQPQVARRPARGIGTRQAELRGLDRFRQFVRVERRVGREVLREDPLFLGRVPVFQARIAQPRLGMCRVFHKRDRRNPQLRAKGVDLQAERPLPTGIDRADTVPRQPRLGRRVGVPIEQPCGRVLQFGRPIAEHCPHNDGVAGNQIRRQRQGRGLGVGPELRPRRGDSPPGGVLHRRLVPSRVSHLYRPAGPNR